MRKNLIFFKNLSLDGAHHCALHFMVGFGHRVHHCSLYVAAEWLSLDIHRLFHWFVFIYKSMLGRFLLICVYVCKNCSQYSLRSHNIIQMFVPRVRTELGKKKAFKYTAPVSWNNLQQALKLSELVMKWEWKSILKERENSSFGQCDCF